MLGLTNDARVHISAPGVDVVITGEPEQVRHLLGVVKHELERNASRRPERRKALSDSQVVRPSELDEMDSPYALPEASGMVKPVEDETIDEASHLENQKTPADDETVDQPYRPPARHNVRVTAADVHETRTAELKRNRPSAVVVTGAPSTDQLETAQVRAHVEPQPQPTTAFDDDQPEAATLLPSDIDAEVTPGEQMPVHRRPVMTGVENIVDAEHGTKIDSGPELEAQRVQAEDGHTQLTPPKSTTQPDGEIEATAISKNPSGPAILPQSESNPFVTDGGPTLTPSESKKDLTGTDPEVVEVSDSDVREL